MAQVLGRVTGVHLDSPRGADVVHTVRVPPSWLERGDKVEVTLPRNLCCAQCSGGGCDRCSRSGAVSLWGKNEPPAVIDLTLPKRSASELESDPAIVLRIPDVGGWPEPGSGHPRGLLLLKVTASAEADPTVTRVSLTPPRLSLPVQVIKASLRPVAKRPWLGFLLLGLLALVVVYWLFRR